MASKNLAASGVLYTDRRVFYLDPQEHASLYPAVAPFVTILMNKGARPTPDPDFKLFEHRPTWRYQYFDLNDATPTAWSAATPGGTAANTVDGATGVTVDASLIGREVEIYASDLTTYKGNALVTAVSGSTVTLKVIGKPDVSNFANNALADNDRFYVLGYAGGEGTDAPEADSDELEVVWNSCQVQKTAVQVNHEVWKSKLRGARMDELSRLREQKGKDHKMKLAKTFYWGMRTVGIGGTAHNAGGGTDSTHIGTLTDASSNVVRKTMGIIPAIKRYGRTSGDQQNFFQRAFGSYTYDQWVEDSDKMFQYQPNSGFLVAMAGPGAMNFFSKVGAEGFLTSSGKRENITFTDVTQSAIGFNFRELHTPSGIVRLVPEQLFRGTPYKNNMVIINEDNLDMVQFEADEYKTNIKTDNDPRYIKDQYFSNSGLGITLMEGHSYFEFS